MNTTEHTVKEILSQPYFKYLWCVDVMVESWGSVRKTTVHFSSEDEARKLSIGYKFEA